MSKQEDVRSTAGRSRRGRPPASAPQRYAYAKTAQAIASLARAGADHLNQLAGLEHAPRSGPSRGMWWGAERLAGVVSVGSSAADAFNRLATGRHVIAADKAVSYMARIIKAGLLPAEALDEMAPTAGHARAMAPFQSILPDLQRLGPFTVPGPELAGKVDALAAEFRSALVNRSDAAGDDRRRLRSARERVVQALLALRAACGREPQPTREVAFELLAAVDELSSTMASLIVTTWTLNHSPRTSLEVEAAQLGPACTVSGEPDFKQLLGWLMQHAVPVVPDRSRLIHQFCERVRSRWGVDLFPAASSVSCTPPARSSLKLIDWCFNFDADGVCIDFEDQMAADGELRPVAQRLPAFLSLSTLGPERGQYRTKAERRFLAKVCSPRKPYNFEFMVVMAMAERWFFGDQEPDDVESDFADWLLRVRDWAEGVSQLPIGICPERSPQEALIRPNQTCPLTTGDIKRLVKQLVRLDTRPRLEMNLDLPESESAVPVAP